MSTERARRVYRLLLRCFPADFRATRGWQMEQVFLDMRAEQVKNGDGVGVGFWVVLIWDTLKEAVFEWLGVIREVRRSGTAMTMGDHMSAIWGDVRFALRQLVRQPMYALTVVVLMSVGVAGNAAVFRVVNGLFLRPLPFDEPGQLVDLDETAPQWDLEFLSIAYRDFDRWRAENSTFQAMAVTNLGGGNALIDGNPVHVWFLNTSHDIDDVLAIEPLLGRFYGPEEDHPDGPRGGLLSRAFWNQHFDGDPSVLGRSITVNGYPIEVIGILPPEAEFLAEVDMWLPMRADPAEFNGWGLSGIGRLREGVMIEQARQDLMTIHKAMIPEFNVNEISSPVVSSLRDRYLGDYRLGSGFLLGSVAIVLLIACANIAALMFARSLARSSEMAVRMAMGAPRRRIVRQLLTESLVLAGIGGAAGLALGVWGSGAIVAPLSDQFPLWVTFDLDPRFLGVIVGVTAVAAVLFGLAPALQASSAHARLGTTRTTHSRARRRTLSALVTGEVALAMTLLVVGSLAVLDVRRLAEVDPGFEAEGLIAYSISLPPQRYEDSEARLAFAEQYLDRVGEIPGVRSATLSTGLPLSGHWGTFFQVDGAPPRGDTDGDPVVLNRVVGPDYFETVGVEIAAGRVFNDFDGRDDGSRAVIVNETFVRTHLAHLDDPVGARITQGTEVMDDSSWLTIVGVARDVKHYGVDEEMRPGVYQPVQQTPLARFQMALSVSGERTAIMSAARTATAEFDSELPLYEVQTMTEELDKSLFTRRAMSWLIAAFSTVALLLAVAGIYGVISYTVGQRSHEIGIRMAMGAQKEDVLTEVVRQGMTLVLIGTVVGAGVSFAGSSVVSQLFIGVEGTEPLVYVAVAGLLVGVASIANYLPARRAARTNPMGVLRGE